jgi:hypothetical protein
MASNPSKIRTLLEGIRTIGPALTDEEVSDIAKVILRATERLEKENNK